ncbi:MAG: cysteine desulfurase CsdA [Pseudobdellovibrio sp.]|jgi:cysteine desulfurase/selenocysteine lyase|nr:cysteine desulfurase CsdA [Pseudobdellovibrio sp.]
MSSELLKSIREEFPALKQKVHGKDLVYLDSAATALKPRAVIERLNKFYTLETANVHRGAHYLSDAATTEFEKAREAVRLFLNADSIEEVIFTRGTTEGINLVAQSYGQEFLNEGDEIVLTEIEHHSNIVPWQILAQKRKCVIKYISVNEDGSLNEADIESIIGPKTKMVVFTGCSNIVGTLPPVEKIVAKARSVGAVTLLDAAQYVTQKKTDVKKLDVDFLVFSSHKLFGPFGFGVLYGKKELLNKMAPYQSGGSMISAVGYHDTTYNHLPFKFEAGTPHVSGAIGTMTAIEFLKSYPMEQLFNHEQKLMQMLLQEFKQIEGLKVFGDNSNKAAIISFNLAGAHHSDIGQILDQQGVAVRVGHHCTQPLLAKFKITGTVRASISIYNNESDVAQLVEGVKKAQRMLL